MEAIRWIKEFSEVMDDVNNPVHLPDMTASAEPAAQPATLRDIVERAFNYRGDVTIKLHHSSNTIEGYVYDRVLRASERDSTVRVIAKTDGSRHTLALADIDAIEFTGKDTAAGKSFETWVRKYVEKKLKGETASIHAEPLDED
jgi:hypothetical protein